jgi:hypothetical protein
LQDLGVDHAVRFGELVEVTKSPQSCAGFGVGKRVSQWTILAKRDAAPVAVLDAGCEVCGS